MTRRTLALTVAAAAAYKSAEHLAVFGPLPWVLIGSLLALGALWTLLRQRAGMAVIAAGAVVANLTPAYRNHLVLLAWIAATLALFPDEGQERFALRWTLSIMYGFAAAAKLWPGWLSGEALLARTWSAPLMPEPALLAAVWATIVVEAALAYGVWSRWRGWLWVAVATHLAFAVLTHDTLLGVARLTVFGVLSIALWLRAARAPLALPLVGPVPTRRG